MKKIIALLVAVLMITASVSALAAEPTRTFNTLAKTDTTSSLTIKNTGKTAHSFELYQIFKGDIDNTGTLSNIEWGNGVKTDYTTGKDARTTAEGLKVAADAKAFADTLTNGNLATTPSDKKDNIVAGANAEFAGLNPGYYLVIDKANSQDNVEEGAYTAYIMEVVGTVTANTKLDIPSVNKAVSDNDAKDKTVNGSTKTNVTIGDKTYDFYETADHAINESFYFDLTATIPGNANMAEYKSYALTFKDTFSKGVTFENIASVVVTNNGNSFTITEGTGDANYSKTIVPSTASTNGTFDLSIADVLKVGTTENPIDLTKDTTITVIYSAHLNENAIVTNASGDYVVNDNKVYIEYSNEPNGDGKGKTKPDDVWVFTYELDNIKVASDKLTEIASPGAEITGLTYSASGYAKKDGVVYFKETKDGTTKYYTVAMPDGTVKFALKDSNGTAIKFSYDATGKFYYPDATNGSNELVPKSDNGGMFNIHGLDEGTYTLTETAVPDGYNKAADITVTITVNTETGHFEATTGGKAHVDLTITNGDNIIVNEKGATLPSTGGIGTTIFYVAGSLMVLAAAILLITKRRMGAND